jgi:hypothetical protein
MRESIDPTKYLHNPPGPISDVEFQNMIPTITEDKLDLPQWGRIDDGVLVVLCKQCGYRYLFCKENDQMPGRCEKCGYDGTGETALPY